MKTANETIPFIATHPGEFLKDEIDARDLSQTDLAKSIGLNKSQLNEIIKGKRNLNADLALLLEKVLGIDADFWMEAQKNFDLDVARIKASENKRIQAIEEMKIAREQIAYKFLKKEKWITGDPLLDVDTVKDIYGVKELNLLPGITNQQVYARFRRSSKLQIDKINIIGWTKVVEYRAARVTTGEFSKENKELLIESLKEIICENRDTKNRAQELLMANGIKLIFQAKGEKTPVDGVSFWSNGNPAIGMSLRHKRLDNFAFTLFHELGHVYEHLVKDPTQQFIDLDPSLEVKTYQDSKEEKQANRFAEKILLGDQEWEEYFERHAAAPFDDENILKFSEEVGIHPGILRGQICFRLNFYKSRTAIDNSLN